MYAGCRREASPAITSDYHWTVRSLLVKSRTTEVISASCVKRRLRVQGLNELEISIQVTDGGTVEAICQLFDLYGHGGAVQQQTCLSQTEMGHAVCNKVATNH